MILMIRNSNKDTMERIARLVYGDDSILCTVAKLHVWYVTDPTCGGDDNLTRKQHGAE